MPAAGGLVYASSDQPDTPLGGLAKTLFVGIDVAQGKVRGGNVGMFAEQIGAKANCVGDPCAVGRCQPVGLLGLRSFIGCSRKREL